MFLGSRIMLDGRMLCFLRLLELYGDIFLEIRFCFGLLLCRDFVGDVVGFVARGYGLRRTSPLIPSIRIPIFLERKVSVLWWMQFGKCPCIPRQAFDCRGQW
jgi:hypothetical protein